MWEPHCFCISFEWTNHGTWWGSRRSFFLLSCLQTLMNASTIISAATGSAGTQMGPSAAFVTRATEHQPLATTVKVRMASVSELENTRTTRNRGAHSFAWLLAPNSICWCSGGSEAPVEFWPPWSTHIMQRRERKPSLCSSSSRLLFKGCFSAKEWGIRCVFQL